MPVTGGTTYWATTQVKTSVDDPLLYVDLGVMWYDSSGAGITTTTSDSIVATTTWQELSFSTTAPANAAYAALLLTWTDAGKADLKDMYWWYDALLFTEFPLAGGYFDGDTAGASWSGTSGNSTSTYGSDNPTDTYVLWVHGEDGYEFERCWWAKGRIWAVDNTGRWYTLSPVGGTAVSTDASSADSHSQIPGPSSAGGMTICECPADGPRNGSSTSDASSPSAKLRTSASALRVNVNDRARPRSSTSWPERLSRRRSRKLW